MIVKMPPEAGGIEMQKFIQLVCKRMQLFLGHSQHMIGLPSTFSLKQEFGSFLCNMPSDVVDSGGWTVKPLRIIEPS